MVDPLARLQALKGRRQQLDQTPQSKLLSQLLLPHRLQRLNLPQRLLLVKHRAVRVRVKVKVKIKDRALDSKSQRRPPSSLNRSRSRSQKRLLNNLNRSHSQKLLNNRKRSLSLHHSLHPNQSPWLSQCLPQKPSRNPSHQQLSPQLHLHLTHPSCPLPRMAFLQPSSDPSRQRSPQRRKASRQLPIKQHQRLPVPMLRPKPQRKSRRKRKSQTSFPPQARQQALV